MNYQIRILTFICLALVICQVSNLILWSGGAPSEVWWANISSSSSSLPLVLPPVLAAPLGPVLATVAVVVAVGHSAHDHPGHHHHQPHQHQQWTHASEVTHSKHSSLVHLIKVASSNSRQFGSFCLFFKKRKCLIYFFEKCVWNVLLSWIVLNPFSPIPTNVIIRPIAMVPRPM